MESKYSLVILAAKRARQIRDGARKLIETKSTNALTIALEEIAAGAIIARIVEDATVAAHQAALEPHEPSLEDIIGAGPVLVLDGEQDTAAAQIAALRSAEPDADDDDLGTDDDEDLAASDAYPLATTEMIDDIDEEEEIADEMADEDES